MTLGLCHAAQILRPPRADLPYLRGPAVAEQTLEPGSVLLDDDRIASVVGGPGVSGPHAGEEAADADLVVDCSGCAVLPGFVDCHTHLPFAGWRAEEYEQRVTGVPYEEIARSGGGIRSSARSFAAASDEAVLAQASALADEMLAHGTTTFECKSGYGGSVAGEMRALALAAELGERVIQRTVSTALLAHSVPDGFDADGWMDCVAALMPELTGIAALDIYVESVAFSNAHLTRMGQLATGAGLALRAHVEQFNANRSVPVALEAGARSVDHLARLHPDDVAPLAAAECAAVLLPGAAFLGGEAEEPARALMDAGALCVLGTDANPGTSPVVSLPLIAGLAVRRYGWSVREALAAMTLNAAWVLELHDQLGTIEPGKRADLIVLDAPAEHIPYRLGHNPVALAIVGGEVVHVRPDQAWRVQS